jgi:hypothetical protein
MPRPGARISTNLCTRCDAGCSLGAWWSVQWSAGTGSAGRGRDGDKDAVVPTTQRHGELCGATLNGRERGPGSSPGSRALKNSERALPGPGSGSGSGLSPDPAHH